MELSARMEAERELGKMGADQLRRERVTITNDLKRLQDQIGDLAFNNYRTYANANRTAKHCQQTFTELNGILNDMSHRIPTVVKEVEELGSASRKQRHHTKILKEVIAQESSVKKILEMPALMDLCIRTGSYDAAYALTNFGISLQQQVTHMKDGEYKKLFSEVAERLVSSRSFLLEELFNKFGGPLDLAESIQVVKNVRKIPYLTNTQLRVSILQYRDLYLDKQILDVSSNPEFALQAIEIYRNCMYDTMVLYMAVFPENEIVRRDPGVDPRWEQWPASGPSAVLSEWGVRNVYRLLELIERADMKSQVDMSALWNKLMAFAASFGRMGLDFRPLIVESLMTMVKKRFANMVRQVTQRLVNEVKRIDVHGGDANWESTGLKSSSTDGPPQPAAEISMCDELCIYGNGIVESLNVLRYSLSPVLLPFVVTTIRDSLLSVFSWMSSHKNSAHFPRALRILAIHLLDFFNKCILFYFPYSMIHRLYGSTLPRHEYEGICDLNIRQILNECDGGDMMREILQTDLEPPKVEDDVLESLLAKKVNGDITDSESNANLVEQDIDAHFDSLPPMHSDPTQSEARSTQMTTGSNSENLISALETTAAISPKISNLDEFSASLNPTQSEAWSTQMTTGSNSESFLSTQETSSVTSPKPSYDFSGNLNPTQSETWSTQMTTGSNSESLLSAQDAFPSFSPKASVDYLGNVEPTQSEVSSTQKTEMSISEGSLDTQMRIPTADSTQLSDMDICSTSSIADNIQTDSTKLSSMDIVTTSSVGPDRITDITNDRYETPQTSVRFSIDGDEEETDEQNEKRDSFKTALSASNTSNTHSDTIFGHSNVGFQDVSTESTDKTIASDGWGWNEDNDDLNCNATIEIPLHDEPSTKSPITSTKTRKDSKMD